MEQRRRTMRTTNKKRKNKKIWTAIGIILGLALLFFVSYKISYGLFSSGSDNKNEITQSTEEDIASMSREELEKKYKELKKQLEEKEEEIKMLDERQKNGGDTNVTPAPLTPEPTSSVSDTSDSSSPSQQTASPSQTSAPKATQAPEPQQTQAPVHTQTPAPAPPAPTEAPKNLMTPEDLANMAGASGQ